MMNTIVALIMLTGLMCGTVFAAGSPEKPEKKIMKPALLVIDIQKQYLPMMSQEDQEQVMKMINYSIYLFRQQGLPVIRIYHTDPTWGPAPDTELFEFPESIKILPEDPKIIKTYPNGFAKTDLDKVLKEKGCNTLFICGLSAAGCALATYMGAAEHDYEAFLIKSALLSHNAEQTKQIEEIFNALNLGTVQFMLERL